MVRKLSSSCAHFAATTISTPTGVSTFHTSMSESIDLATQRRNPTGCMTSLEESCTHLIYRIS